MSALPPQVFLLLVFALAKRILAGAIKTQGFTMLDFQLKKEEKGMLKTNKTIAALLVALFICVFLPITGFARNVTLNLSSSSGKVADEITASGIADADEWVSIKIVDVKGSIVYYDAVKSDADGKYSNTFKIPDVKEGTLTVVAGYGSNVDTKTLKVVTTTGGDSDDIDDDNETDKDDNEGSRRRRKSGGSGGSGGKKDIKEDKKDVVDETKKPAPPITHDPGSKTATVTTKLTAETDSQGTAKGLVTKEQLVGAITKAAEKAATAEAAPTIEIQVSAQADAKTVKTSIPSEALDQVAASQVQTLTVSSPIASVTFDKETLNGLSSAAKAEDIVVATAKADKSALSAEAQAKVGDRPVYNFSVQSGGSTISNFSGEVTVSVPYSPKAGEDNNAIVIYYVKADGTLETVQNCIYDSKTGTVSFKTSHFSTYVVGYNKVNFNDVSGWYDEYVSYLAARDIVKGKGAGRFEPTASITRAEFAQLLANLSGDDFGTYTGTSFSDVKSGAWYAQAVQWAYKNGVVMGSNGKFNPTDRITRQEMAVMIARYADKVAKFSLPKKEQATSFTDQDSIAAYATEAVNSMQRAGIISGRNDNSFAPKDNATRAESSKMVAVLIKLMLE